MSAPRKVKVFLCGEGANELGSRNAPRAFQHDREPGVLHVLLERVQREGWEVGGARSWKQIPKYRVGRAAHQDTRNVEAAALDAREAECDVLAFSRDVDTESGRKDAIEEGIKRVTSPSVIGGAAVPTLEGWVLALLGVAGSEALSPKRAEKLLEENGIPRKDTAAMVHVVESADVAALPKDATSLRLWLDRAQVLTTLVNTIAGDIP